MLDRIHGQAGSQHQNENNEKRSQELLCLAGDDLADDIQGIVIGVDAEQPQDARHPDQAERDRAGREEHRHVVRQERKQVNNAGTGFDVLPVGRQALLAGIEAGGGKNAQDIVQRKEGDRDRLYTAQELSVLQRDGVEGPCKGADQIDEQHGRADHIIALIDRVIHDADRHHLEDALAERFPLFSGGRQTNPSFRRHVQRTEYSTARRAVQGESGTEKFKY